MIISFLHHPYLHEGGICDICLSWFFFSLNYITVIPWKKRVTFFDSLVVPLFTIRLPVGKIQISTYFQLMLIYLCSHIWYKTFTYSVTKSRQSFLRPTNHYSMEWVEMSGFASVSFDIWGNRKAVKKRRVQTEFCWRAFQPPTCPSKSATIHLANPPSLPVAKFSLNMPLFYLFYGGFPKVTLLNRCLLMDIYLRGLELAPLKDTLYKSA